MNGGKVLVQMVVIYNCYDPLDKHSVLHQWLLFQPSCPSTSEVLSFAIDLSLKIMCLLTIAIWQFLAKPK